MFNLQNTGRKTYNTTWVMLASSMCHHCKYCISVKFYVILDHDWESCVFSFLSKAVSGSGTGCMSGSPREIKNGRIPHLNNARVPSQPLMSTSWGHRAGHPVFRGLQMIPSGWGSLGHGVLCTMKAQLLLMRAVFVFGTTARNTLP